MGFVYGVTSWLGLQLQDFYLELSYFFIVPLYQPPSISFVFFVQLTIAIQLHTLTTDQLFQFMVEISQSFLNISLPLLVPGTSIDLHIDPQSLLQGLVF